MRRPKLNLWQTALAVAVSILTVLGMLYGAVRVAMAAGEWKNESEEAHAQTKKNEEAIDIAIETQREIKEWLKIERARQQERERVENYQRDKFPDAFPEEDN